MSLKYLRFDAFRFFLVPFSEKSRKKRMHYFARKMGVREGMSVLDLGGQPMIWDNAVSRLHITILNLPGVAVTKHASHHDICFVEGDACAVEGFADRSFDIVFSNSVIEHVG